jgi:hypothetical protein
VKHSRLLAGITIVPALAATIVACSSANPSTGSGGATSYAPPTPAVDLAGACPSTVVLQQDWEPEADHAAAYQLLGSGYTVDANHKRVTGPLVIDGMNTGVQIQIRAGGSAIGFQSVSSQMYVDTSITLGAVTTDGAIVASTTHPVTAVVAPLEKSPQILLWDPASHPSWHTVGDIGKTNAKVVVSTGGAFASLLVNKGLIKSSQVDESYTGSPARFVASPDIALQGFATAEPYVYQHEVTAWDKPVNYQLLADVGYNVYPEALSVRTSALSSLAPCLKKLVPILQRSQVDYITNPGPTDNVIVDVVKQYNDSWTYSAGEAAYSADTMKKLGIVANDTSGPLGGIDMSRMTTNITTFGPILASTGAKVKSGLTASDLATDQFVDPSIKLK